MKLSAKSNSDMLNSTAIFICPALNRKLSGQISSKKIEIVLMPRPICFIFSFGLKMPFLTDLVQEGKTV